MEFIDYVAAAVLAASLSLTFSVVWIRLVEKEQKKLDTATDS
jgi:hypothetical protein